MGLVVAELKSLSFHEPPADPEHFGVAVQAFVGETGDDAADSFDLLVCTPGWLAAQADWSALHLDDGMPGAAVSLPGAGLWFQRRWDPDLLAAGLRRVCALSSPGPDWGTVAARIARLVPWEYAYRYDARAALPPGGDDAT